MCPLLQGRCFTKLSPQLSSLPPPPFFFLDMLTLNSLPVADTGFQLLISLPFPSKCWDDTGSPVVDVQHCLENLACLKNGTHPLAPHPPFPITSLPCSSAELWVRISSFPGSWIPDWVSWPFSLGNGGFLIHSVLHVHLPLP